MSRLSDDRKAYIDNLPAPLLDRFRQIVFPKPSEADLQALLPAVVTDILRDQGMDQRWIDGLSLTETAAIAHHWRGVDLCDGSAASSRSCCASATAKQAAIERCPSITRMTSGYMAQTSSSNVPSRHHSPAS